VSLCMVPEPFVTQITSKNPDVKIALDLTKEWDKVAENGAALTMGCMIVRNDFLEEHPDAVSAFMEEYKASVEYVNANPHEAGIISEKYDILAADVAEKAIPNCNIVYIDGEEMQSALSGFLQVLYDANPQAVGGSLPDEAFYYKK
ncbi:MAG TPA: ABC transporter substrate-binding protein, partial [Firmicutes bacterium]|nr:ABC transporter substrate-binding protein [Bacillota bacterium]